MDLEVVYTDSEPLPSTAVFEPNSMTGGDFFFTAADPADRAAAALFVQRLGGSVETLDNAQTLQPVGGEPAPVTIDRRSLNSAPFAEECQLSERAVIAGTYRDEEQQTRKALFRVQADGRLVPEVVSRQSVPGGELEIIGRLPHPVIRQSPCGDLAFVATLSQQSTEVLFRQSSGPGSSLQSVLRTGEVAPGQSGLNIEGIQRFSPQLASTVVRVLHDGGATAVGRASAVQGFKCLVTTQASQAACLTAGAQADRIAFSANDELAAVRIDAGRIDVFPAGATAPITIMGGAPLDGGGELPLGLDPPAVCGSTGDVFFVGRGVYHDLFVRRMDGRLERLTDFAALDERLGDTVGSPRQVVAMSVGDSCDVFLMTQGRDQYRGLWSVWPDGTLARVIDAGQSITTAPGAMETVASWALDLGSPFTHYDGSRDGGFRVIDVDGTLGLGLEYQSGIRGWVRATKPADQCRPTGDVNTVGDGSDVAPGDGRCNTGGTAPNGDPECTLRAAIEEANARQGPSVIRFDIEGAGPYVIRPASELPPIRAPVRVAGDRSIEIDGQGTIGGLVVESPGVRIEGLTVLNVASEGIRTDQEVLLTLVGVSVQGACGFGVFSRGGVRLEGASGVPALVQGSGRGDGCEGGGIFSAGGAAVGLTGVEISNNGGPGVLADGLIQLEDVAISGNDAQGVVAAMDDGGLVQTRIRASGGRIVIADNGGHGLHAEDGNVRLSPFADVEVARNRGFGVFIELGLFFDGSIGFLGEPVGTLIRANGAADRISWTINGGEPEALALETAPGGGVFAFSNEREGERQSFLRTVIEANQGPGILTTASLALIDVRILDNAGEGVAIRQGDLTVLSDWTAISAPYGASTISGNRGHGVLIESGQLSSSSVATWTITGNGGWGVVTDGGALRIGNGSPRDLSQPASRISENGAGANCRSYDIGSDDLPEGRNVTCGGGGVAVLDVETEESSLDNVELAANQGPGAYVEGSLEALRVTARANSGPGLQIAGDPEGQVLRFELGPHVVEDNLSHGIEVDEGNVRVLAGNDLTVLRNSGWGVLVFTGTMELQATSVPAPKTVANNDFLTECWTWTQTDPEPLPTFVLGPCDGGGIRLEDGQLVATNLTVRDHAGTGIYVRSGDVGNGSVTLNGGDLCRNGIDIDADGTVTQNNVGSSCP